MDISKHKILSYGIKTLAVLLIIGGLSLAITSYNFEKATVKEDFLNSLRPAVEEKALQECANFGISEKDCRDQFFGQLDAELESAYTDTIEMPFAGETSMEEIHYSTGMLKYYGIGALIVGIILLFYISAGTIKFIGTLGYSFLISGIGLAIGGFALKKMLTPGLFLEPGEESFAPVLAKWITEKIANPNFYAGIVILIIGIIFVIAFLVVRKHEPAGAV